MWILFLDCRFGDQAHGCLVRLCPFYVQPELCCATCHEYLSQNTTTVAPTTNVPPTTTAVPTTTVVESDRLGMSK